MFNRQRPFTLAVGAVLFAVACPFTAARAETPTEDMSIHNETALDSADDSANLVEQIEPPTTALDLLRNVKWAIDHKLFLRRDFFTEQNIARLLGKYPLRWADDRADKKFVTIDESAERGAYAAAPHGCVLAAVISWLVKQPSQLPKVQVSIALRSSDSGCAAFSADAIRAAFGEPANVRSVFPAIGPPNPHRQLVPMSTSHPWGNTDVEYELRNGKTVSQIKLEVLGNGSIREFRFLSEEF